MFFFWKSWFFSHFRHWHPEVWSLMSSHSKSPNAYKVTVMHLNRKKDELIMVLLGVLFQTLPTSIKADIHRQQTLDFQQQNPLAASRSRFVVSLSLNPWNEASSNCTLFAPINYFGTWCVHSPHAFSCSVTFCLLSAWWELYWTFWSEHCLVKQLWNQP